MVALEIKLRIGCLAMPVKTAFANGLDFADAVLGVVNVLTC